MLVIKLLKAPIDFHTMTVYGIHQLSGYQYSPKYLERNSYRFGPTWGWV